MQPHDLTRYLDANFDRSIYRDANGSGFRGLDLPYPYSSPCIKGEGKFYFFFYWDTAFTNLGLLRTGRMETARDNIRNMLWLIDRYGYMPNHVGITNRSQPPWLCQMVRDYFDAIGGPERDADFFRACAEGLRREYFFWTLARHTPSGLQRHGEHDVREGHLRFAGNKRVQALGFQTDADEEARARVGAHHLAEAETGWDFTPRFEGRCLDFNPADLNGLLYGNELFLGEAAERLGWGDTPLWQERAESRRARVNELLWNAEAGWYFDFDFVNRRQSPVRALSGLLPLFSGLADPAQAEAVRKGLSVLERAHGVAVTDPVSGEREYQWAYPNAWPPLTYVTVTALRRYGFHDDADRIARKHLAVTEALFAKTGQLWEKTDVESGEVAGGEYDAAPMIGWSAGVYLALREGLRAGSGKTDA